MMKVKSKIRENILESSLFGGRSFTIPSPQLSLSDICNAQCNMCWIHSPYVKDSTNPEASLFTGDNPPPSIMTWESFAKIVEGLSKMGVRSVGLVGKGEPTLNPKFLQMCRYLKDHNISFGLVTNGFRLSKEIVDGILDEDVRYIRVSLNAADEETFKTVNLPRQKDITLAKVIRNKEYLIERRNMLGLKTKISAGFVISKCNVQSLEDMIRLGSELADSVILMNISAFSEIHHLLLDREDFTKIKEMINGCENDLKRKGCTINAEDFLHKVDLLTQSEDQTSWLRPYFRTNHCRIPFGFCVIHADGRVSPCCPTSYICGNAVTDGFDKIWNSKAFRAFRLLAYNIPKRGKEAPQSNCFNCDHFL